MLIKLKIMWNLVLPILMAAAVASLAISKSASDSHDPSTSREARTINMDMMGMKGMGLVKDMFQNGMGFRPFPPPFSSLRNLFKVNGTHLTWVPLGSLIFNNNGKIIGG